MSLQGVQIDNPSMKERAMEYTVFQMMYHRKVSRKKSTRSMKNMIVRVKMAWLRQSEFPKIFSLQFWIFIPAMVRMGSRNARVRKKYDSVNLHPKTRNQRKMLPRRAWECRTG